MTRQERSYRPKNFRTAQEQELMSYQKRSSREERLLLAGYLLGKMVPNYMGGGHPRDGWGAEVASRAVTAADKLITEIDKPKDKA